MAGLCLIGGCGASPSGVIDRWAAANGGVLMDARQDRARQALTRLSVSPALAPRLSVAVLDTDAVGAFCWPSGAVFVTRGLVDVVDDDELCAALAHEAGHLVADGHIPRPVALDGWRRPSATDAEIAADLTARVLLKRSAVSEQALPRLLGKLVAHSGASAARRAHLSRRIAHLATADESR
jgi:predicted Zn-dependent protease